MKAEADTTELGIAIKQAIKAIDCRQHSRIRVIKATYRSSSNDMGEPVYIPEIEIRLCKKDCCC